MDLIFRIEGSDLTREKNVSYSPQVGWTVKANGQYLVIESVFLDLDDTEQQVIYVDLKKEKDFLPKTANGIAKCVSPFEQSGNLTETKDYPILKVNDTHFFIIDDKGTRRSYKHGNSQFVILK